MAMVTAECNKMTLPAVVEARGPQTARFSPAGVEVCHSPWHEDSFVVERSMSVTRETPHSSQNSLNWGNKGQQLLAFVPGRNPRKRALGLEEHSRVAHSSPLLA
jgi:hypothetical protein